MTLPALPRGLPFKRALTLLVAVPVLTFGWTLGNDFVEWDDPSLVTENPIVQNISLGTIKTAFTTYDPELYIPLTLMSYQADHLIGGNSPVVYHLHNLILHVLSVLLVAWLLYLLTGDGMLALLGGLLFAAHPLQTETVAWVSARKDLMSGFWGLMSIISYMYALEKREQPPVVSAVEPFLAAGSAPKNGRSLYILSILAFLLALLSKVSIIILPALLFLIDWYGRHSMKDSVKRIWPYVFLSVIFGIIAVIGKQAFVTATSPMEMILLGTKAVTQLATKFFLPTGLSLLYPYTGSITFTAPALIIPLLLVVVVVLVLFVLLLRARGSGTMNLTFGALWFLICLLSTFPASRRGEHLGDLYITSDRFFYLAGIGLIFLAALLLSRLIRRHRQAGIMVSTVILGTLMILSIRQTFVWHDSHALFENVLALQPDSHIAHVRVGNDYQSQGAMERALAEYDAALKIRPTSLAYFNAGKAMLALGQIDQAILLNQKALELDPALAIAEVNLGVGYVKKQMWTEAAAAFQRAIALNPQSLEAHFNLGAMFEKLNRPQDALKEYQKALELSPGLEQARARMEVLQK